MIYAKLGESSAAKNYLQQAVSRNPNFSVLYAHVATDTLSALGSTVSRK